jgi:prepilin-type N-terminal cleavage/methylation domain-containing protein
MLKKDAEMGRNKQKSFTLMEIIVAIIVIAILVKIALPRYNRAVEKSRIAEVTTILNAIHASQMRYAVKHDVYAESLPVLDIGEPQGKYFDFILDLDANPIDEDTNQTLAVAQRNNLGAGVFPPNYVIGITEQGELYTTVPEVTSLLLLTH